MDKCALANGGIRSTVGKQQWLVGLQLLVAPSSQEHLGEAGCFFRHKRWLDSVSYLKFRRKRRPTQHPYSDLFAGLCFPQSGQAWVPRGISVSPFPHSHEPTETCWADLAGGCWQARHVQAFARVILLMGGCNVVWLYRQTSTRAPRAGKQQVCGSLVGSGFAIAVWSWWWSGAHPGLGAHPRALGWSLAWSHHKREANAGAWRGEADQTRASRRTVFPPLRNTSYSCLVRWL